nr:hypothetical transcript [Hymenolepis microstoma]
MQSNQDSLKPTADLYAFFSYEYTLPRVHHGSRFQMITLPLSYHTGPEIANRYRKPLSLWSIHILAIVCSRLSGLLQCRVLDCRLNL